MISVNIVKNYPASFRLGVKNNDVVQTINDGTWTLSAELRYQTKNGAKPFEITTLTPNGNSVIIELTDTQTALLDHRGNGYVLIFYASKNDETVFLKSETQVNVRDEL